jgi:Uncharacterized conserved protein
MLALQACGWGSKRIAAELGCSRNTVKRWLAEGGWRGAKSPGRPKTLDGLESWLAERFRQHAGNADVVRQELCAGITRIRSISTTTSVPRSISCCRGR